MAKLGLLFPHEEMTQMAGKIIEEKNLRVVYIKTVQTVNAVQEAREAIEAGADILVCRGYQAMLIKRNTKIPVVEVRLHAQEIGLLLKKAKVMTKKECPRVGLIVFSNMLSDMSYMEELFDVKLMVRYIDRVEEGPRMLRELAGIGIDLVIGGEMVCEEAERMGYPTLIYRSSRESLLEAVQEAERIGYAMEAEKQSAAQFETVLDTSFNGIIKINNEGNITVINKLVENLIGKNLEEVAGLPVMEIFPDFDRKAIWDVLGGSRDSYTISVNLRQQAWILLVAPIQYDEHITGAILSLQKISESMRRSSAAKRDMYLNRFIARTTFKNIYTENEEMRAQIEMAEKYALSDRPVLIYSQEGTEYAQFAEAIHNNSIRRSGPFVSVNLCAVEPERQMELVFGNDRQGGDADGGRHAAAVRANQGTLFLMGLEQMNRQVQHQLLRMLVPDNTTRTDIQTIGELDVRVIGVSKVNLSWLVEQGSFSEKLYYVLQGLLLELPALKERTEDLLYYFKKFFRQYSKKYNKYLVSTQGALEKVKSFAWNGNILQLQVFCERLVLTADRRSIDEVYIQRTYDSLYPHIREQDGQKQVVVYHSPEADELNKLLEKHHGSRAQVAKELGISTTTLWRRMKKYGVEAKYS